MPDSRDRRGGPKPPSAEAPKPTRSRLGRLAFPAQPTPAEPLAPVSVRVPSMSDQTPSSPLRSGAVVVAADVPPPSAAHVAPSAPAVSTRVASRPDDATTLWGGRIRPGEELGSGAMGSVLRGMDTKLRRE